MSIWDDLGSSNEQRHRQSSHNAFSNGINNFNFSKKNIILLVFSVLTILLLSGIYSVKEGEEGLIFRFGRVVRTAKAGLNYRIPIVEEVIIERVNQSRRTEIGYETTSLRGDGQGKSQSVTEKIMLTGDENIIVLNCDVMWNITSLEDYVLNVVDPNNTIKAVTKSAIREVIGRTPISSILSNQKQEIAHQIEKLTQKVLDSYNIGVHIEQIQLLKAEPPDQVISAYRDVQKARADKESSINQAQAYKNDVLPKARGNAAEVIQSAEGYEYEVVAKAKGDTERFMSVYSRYIESPESTRIRMRLEVTNDVFSNSNKIIADSILPHFGQTDFINNLGKKK